MAIRSDPITGWVPADQGRVMRKSHEAGQPAGGGARDNEHAPLDYTAREGAVFDRAPVRGGYGVRFDDGATYPDGRPYPSEGYPDSAWLERQAEAPR